MERVRESEEKSEKKSEHGSVETEKRRARTLRTYLRDYEACVMGERKSIKTKIYEEEQERRNHS
ncbi:hypothetical protein BDN70DRAFT_889103 [Pholiota conissans]|uniref:Uncharacterized protein n=1 Tax=Pholiota conissans TaxID=109636 RepID=A0A9P5YKQ6_9AGAR|nr:hypothetical protein BDN70DRAFT_889103 [Pholiota conissans]